MPGLITPYLPEPERKPGRKILAFVATVLVLLAAAPAAGAGINDVVPNPGWEVD